MLPPNITGSWNLVAWRRIQEDGSITYPLGEDVIGILIYTPDAKMAVQLLAKNRPAIPTDNALGGDVGPRAAAYSTCLAYFGSYRVEGDQIVHQIEGSLFPNWSGTVQARPLALDGDELVLRTPPTKTPTGTVVNEIAWVRNRPELAC